MGLAERCHEALIQQVLGDRLIGPISRDGTAIAVRGKPVRKPETKKAPKEDGGTGSSTDEQNNDSAVV
ncbi:MAG: hypothetical protein G3I11_02740 [Ferrovum sp.]|nr:hypothetical protein [Ferrovum sp.]